MGEELNNQQNNPQNTQLNEVYSNSIENNQTSQNNEQQNTVVQQQQNNQNAQQDTKQNVQENVQQNAQQNVQQNTQQNTQQQSQDQNKQNTLLGEESQVPEKYEFKGADGEEISEYDVKAYSNVAKELGLNQEQAQKFFELSRKEIQETLIQKVQAQSNMWYKEVLNDPEIGGAKFETTKQNIGKVMSKFGTPELRSLFDSSGMGNNPTILKFINKIGESLGEDSTFIQGKNPAREPTKEELLKEIYNKS